jgi:hypothetical protein
MEERQTEDTGIVININQHIIKPAFFADEIKYDNSLCIMLLKLVLIILISILN